MSYGCNSTLYVGPDGPGEGAHGSMSPFASVQSRSFSQHRSLVHPESMSHTIVSNDGLRTSGLPQIFGAFRHRWISVGVSLGTGSGAGAGAGAGAGGDVVLGEGARAGEGAGEGTRAGEGATRRSCTHWVPL